MYVLFAGVTDTGIQREHNEDRFLLLPGSLGVAAVADGAGGYEAGALAAELTLETVGDIATLDAAHRDLWPFPRDGLATDPEDRLTTAIRLANRRILDAVAAEPRRAGMSSSVVATAFDETDDTITIASYGDSRCYLLRGGALAQLTVDHSLLNQRLEPEDGVLVSPIRMMLGITDDVDVDVMVHEVRSGDVYILCSDGLSGMLTDTEIEDIARAAESVERAAETLVAHANAAGGEDNVTVIVARVDAV